MLPPEPPSRQQYIQSSQKVHAVQNVIRRCNQFVESREQEKGLQSISYPDLNMLHTAQLLEVRKWSLSFGTRSATVVPWEFQIAEPTYTLFEKWLVKYLILLSSASDSKSARVMMKMYSPTPLQLKQIPNLLPEPHTAL